MSFTPVNTRDMLNATHDALVRLGLAEPEIQKNELLDEVVIPPLPQEVLAFLSMEEVPKTSLPEIPEDEVVSFPMELEEVVIPEISSTPILLPPLTPQDQIMLGSPSMPPPVLRREMVLDRLGIDRVPPRQLFYGSEPRTPGFLPAERLEYLLHQRIPRTLF